MVVSLKGHADDFTCVLLEYMPHDTFLKILQKGPFIMSVAKTITLSLARVVQIIHNHSVAHCDIKPENILVAADFNLKVCDFGFARFVPTPQAPPGGTPGYTAPEMYENKLLDLKRCDMFALGVVMFIIVLGFPPFQSNGPTARDGWWNMIASRQWETFWSKCEQFRQQIYPIEFKYLVMALLEPDCTRRMEISGLVENEFLKNGCCSEDEVLSEIRRRVTE